MEQRDEFRTEAGDLHRDLEEKESQFDGVRQGGTSAHTDAQDQKRGSGFVDATDPNLELTRRTSELEEPAREGAEELNAIHHNDSRVEGRPMGPLGDEGAVVLPISEQEREPGEDS